MMTEDDFENNLSMVSFISDALSDRSEGQFISKSSMPHLQILRIFLKTEKKKIDEMEVVLVAA